MALCLEIKPNDLVSVEEMDRLQETTFFIIFSFLLVFGGSTQFLLRKLEIAVSVDAPEDYLVPEVEEAQLSTTSRFVRRASRFMSISALPRESLTDENDTSFARRPSVRRNTRRSIKPPATGSPDEEEDTVEKATASSPPAAFFDRRDTSSLSALRLELEFESNPRERATLRTEVDNVDLSRITPKALELPRGSSRPRGSSTASSTPSALRKVPSDNRRTVKISPVVNFQSFNREYSDTVHPKQGAGSDDEAGKSSEASAVEMQSFSPQGQ